MLKRILGILMLLIGVSGIAVAGAGAVYAPRLLDSIGSGVTESLSLTVQSLDTVEASLRLAKTTVDQVNDGLDTVEATAIDVSQTISQTQPLLTQIGQIATQDVPDSLEAIQTSIPDMAQAASVVDDTLTTLSGLSFEQKILGFPIYFDLGIDYAPEVPLEESVNQLGSSLEGIPSQLRSLGDGIEATSDNLQAVSQDLVVISEKLHALNASVAASQTLLDDYLRLVADTKALVQKTQTQITGRLGTGKLAVALVMIWLGLAQLAPLHLGWELAFARRGENWGIS